MDYGDFSSGSIIKARVYDATGKPTMGELRVTGGITDSGSPSIASLPDGNFVVSWSGAKNGTGGTIPVGARVLDPAGNNASFEILVSTPPAANSGYTSTSVAALKSGNFLLTWIADKSLMGRFYAANGAPLGDTFQVNADSSKGVGQQSATLLDNGDLLVTWQAGTTNTPSEIHGQLFDPANNKISTEFTLGGSDGNSGLHPIATALDQNAFAVGWSVGSGAMAGYFRIFHGVTNGTPNADILVGDAAANILNGGSADDQLYGNGGNDTLDGGAGNDVLNGGTGADILIGGAGDDIYDVDTYNLTTLAGDQVVELANGGFDTVYAHVNYVLPDNVEQLVLLDAATRGVGNALDNWIYANDLGNDLSGGLGNDQLFGGAGNDTLAGGGGADILRGGAGNDVMLGDDGNDQLFGDAGVDNLNGGAGNDLLDGGAGADVLTGGAGNDIFQGTRANLNGDRITDLAVGDRITVSDVALANLIYTRSGTLLGLGGGASIDIGGFAGRFVLAANGGGTDLVATAGVARADFSGDGHSDILFRNANGAVSTWNVSGDGRQVQQSAFNANVDTSWKIVESFDWNGDGRSDILWRNADGGVAVWRAEGSGFNQASYYHGPITTAWRIAGTGDLTGDGKDDLLWQNDNGSISAWTSTGTGFVENTYSHGSPGAGWKVEGLGDFTGDGKADILWRNTGGGVAMWSNNGAGTSFNEGAFYQASLSTTWHITGVGDFNGDGRDDILWRNDSGALSVWRSNGSGFDQAVYNTNIPTSWHVDQIGDLNGDGKADLVWRNDNGAVSTWHSNGSGFDQSIYNSSAATSWAIEAHDFVV